MIVLLLTLSLGQIDVRSDGGYVGRARNILDCRGGLACSVDAGVAYLNASGISGGGSSGWRTANDCDFTDAGNVSLDAGASDADYSVCGYTLRSWAMSNAVNMPAVVVGDGLLIQPNAASDMWGATATAPGFQIALSGLIPNFTYSTRWRATIHVTGNFTANYDGFRFNAFSIMSGDYKGWAGALKAYSGGVLWQTEYSYGAANSYVGPTLYTFANQTMGVIEFTGGVAAGTASSYVDFPDGGAFPSQGPGWLLGQSGPVTTGTNWNPFSSRDGISGIKLHFSANRAGSGTNFILKVKRLKVEYWQ